MKFRFEGQGNRIRGIRKQAYEVKEHVEWKQEQDKKYDCREDEQKFVNLKDGLEQFCVKTHCVAALYHSSFLTASLDPFFAPFAPATPWFSSKGMC